MSTRENAPYSRLQIADAIVARLDDATLAASRDAFASAGPIGWFGIDELLPKKMALAIRESFPRPDQMRERKTLREHKYVAAQMDRYSKQAEEALFAYHDARVVEAVARITQLPDLHADPMLYAGGISLMTRGNFLNPHLDNSHNLDRSLYRVLNLLYYVSPQWDDASGGHLELWPHGVQGTPLTVPSDFNRLVVMSTGPGSWHSVSEVRRDEPRCCVSNYYFSPQPVGDKHYFRVTTFRGRPEQRLRDLWLRIDASLRAGVRKLFPRGVVQTSHVYDKAGKPQR
jgi:Rps23 Pro-64 3,4-dihydroxylase Tpa1-like proline 4-hydroxylase